MKLRRLLLTVGLVGVLSAGQCWPGPDNELRRFMLQNNTGQVDVPQQPPRTGSEGHVRWLERHILTLAERQCDLQNKVRELTQQHDTVADQPPCPDPFPDPPPPWPPPQN